MRLGPPADKTADKLLLKVISGELGFPYQHRARSDAEPQSVFRQLTRRKMQLNRRQVWPSLRRCSGSVRNGEGVLPVS